MDERVPKKGGPVRIINDADVPTIEVTIADGPMDAVALQALVAQLAETLRLEAGIGPRPDPLSYAGLCDALAIALEEVAAQLAERSAARLIVVVHQQETLKAVAPHFAGVPGVEVRHDRRVADRRRTTIEFGGPERRQRERRSNSLEGPRRVVYVH